jgi:hypothetical protein
MTTQQPEPAPESDGTQVEGKFQEMLDSGALERVSSRGSEESSYKLHVDAIPFLRKPEAGNPDSKTEPR